MCVFVVDVFVCFEGEKWDNVWAMCNNKKK